jgi:hypothetical protein
MTEEVTPDPGVQDNPSIEAPPEGTSAQAENDDFTSFRLTDVPEEQREHVEKAYNLMRSDYTKKTQELSERRKEAEHALAFFSDLQSDTGRDHALKWLVENVGEQTLIDMLGLEVEDTDEEETPEFRDPRVDEILAEKQRAEEEAELDRLEKSITSQITEMAQRNKLDLTDDETELIFDKVLALPPIDGQPQIEAAFKKVTGIRDSVIKKYRDSKRDQPSPPPVSSASGTPHVPSGNDRKSTLAAANAVVNRIYGSQD